MSSGIFRFFGASVATMLFVGFALAPTPAPAQGLQCASNPLIGTWRLNPQKSTITRNNGVIEPRIMIIAPFGDNGITEVFINDRDPRLVGRWEMWSVQSTGSHTPPKAVIRVRCAGHGLTATPFSTRPYASSITICRAAP